MPTPRQWRRAFTGVASAALLPTFVLGACIATDIRINVSSSYPLGLYRAKPVNGARPDQKGLFFALCLPSSPQLDLARERDYLGPGRCPSGARPLFKQLLAVPGDRVDAVAGGLAVNGGEALPNSKSSAIDGEGRSMRIWHGGPVPEDNGVFLSTHSPASFDSRYLGPLPLSAATDVLQPLWLWN